MVRKAHFWPKYLNFDHFPDIIRDKLAKRQQFGLKLIILSRKSLEMSFLDELHAKFWSILDQKPPFFVKSRPKSDFPKRFHTWRTLADFRPNTSFFRPTVEFVLVRRANYDNFLSKNAVIF